MWYFLFINFQNPNNLRTVTFAYEVPLCLIAIYSVCWKIIDSMSIISLAAYLHAVSTLIFISLRLCPELQIKKHFMLHQYIPADRWLYSLRCRFQLIDFWNGRFESRWGHGYSSLVFFVYFVGSGLCDELIIYSEVCVCVYV